MEPTTMTPIEYLTLDDLAVGQIFRSSSHQTDAEKIKTFAREYDPQPFHLSEESADTSLFGGLAASGWHTAAITRRLMVSSTPILGGLIGMGGGIVWPQPTRPGDLLHVESEVVEIIPSRSRPDRGKGKFRITTRNQEVTALKTL